MRPPKFRFKPAQWGLPIFKSQPQNSLLPFHRNFLVSQPNIFLSHLDQQAMARLTFFSCQVPSPTLPDAEHWAGWTWGHVVLVFPMHGKCHVIPASEQLLHTADISTTGWYCEGVSSKAEMLWHREDGKAHVGCLSTARRAQTSETEQCHQAVQEMLLWCPTAGVLTDLWCPFDRAQGVLLPCPALGPVRQQGR